MNDADSLNRDAFAALVGWERDWRGALSNLLRSDVPISPAVRDAMADVLEGKSPFGISLQLVGHERLARWMDSIKKRQSRLAIGRRVAELMTNAPNVLDAFEEAAERNGVEADYCRRAYYYAKNCEAWIAAATSASSICARMSAEQIEVEFHTAATNECTDKPTPLDGRAFDATMIGRANAAKALVADMGLPDLAAEVIFNLGRITPFHE